MGERTDYAPGAFCWADLTTTDPEAAKAFYGGLFGWQADDIEMPDGIYSLQTIDGKVVGAIAGQPPQQQGAPPLWNSYVRVESADATVERAKELGVEPHAGAFDVGPAGRMAVLQDPAGAYFLAWEPNERAGADLVNGPGLLSWNELHTPDVDAAASFYRDLLGWTVSTMGEGDQRYDMIEVAGQPNGGISSHLDEGVPPHWLVYFGSEDIGASLARAGELGGTTILGETDIGMGRIAVLQDPQGGIFALFSGDFGD
jgi:predicted enzyme related to lactoylglutathione lyase